jgi:hypothetical protein
MDAGALHWPQQEERVVLKNQGCGSLRFCYYSQLRYHQPTVFEGFKEYDQHQLFINLINLKDQNSL